MSFASTVPFQSFWSSSWSAPLRAACVWFKRQPAPVVPKTADALTPGWLRPLCVQRMVGQAVCDRLAWLRAHPDLAASLYPDEAPPGWDRGDWIPYDYGTLRRLSDEWLLLLFQINVERLLHTVRMPPALVGEERWTRSALGTCEHLAQLYREFRRRYQARATRKFVQHVLNLYVVWEGPVKPSEPAVGDEAKDTPIDDLLPV